MYTDRRDEITYFTTRNHALAKVRAKGGRGAALIRKSDREQKAHWRAKRRLAGLPI
jgi:hypothetical protein